MRRCRRCWLGFPTIAALEAHKCLLAPAPSAPTTASTSPPGSEDRQGADGGEAGAYSCPPCSAGNHQACHWATGQSLGCDCARRDHAVRLTGDGSACDNRHCRRQLPDLIAIIEVGGEHGFCSRACAAAWVREHWIECSDQSEVA